MRFLNVVAKVANGTFDFIINAGNSLANKIDRMSDMEIEMKYADSSVEEVRNVADEFHLAYEGWNNRKNRYDD